MKKNLLFIIVIASLISSCKKDYLNLVPPTSLSTASFFKNKSDFIQALNGTYVPLRGMVHAGFFMDEMRSDNTFFTRYAANRGFETSTECLPLFTDDANASAQPNSPGNRYGNNYNGIARANTVISRLAESDLTQSAKDSIMGEALFLRSFYYFDLVTHYGGVPLQLAELKSAEEAFQPRNTVDEVYAQIAKDLTEAIALLPVANSFPQSGRATKGAAKMLLAYAYMQQPTKNLPAAETELKDILAMNYELLGNYADVYEPENKNNSEIIFSVQYKSDLTSGQQSDFTWRFIPKTVNPEFLTGFNGSRMNIFSGWNVPTAEMVQSYEPADKRLNASVAVVEGTISGVEDFSATALKNPQGYVPAPGQVYFYMIRKYFHPPYTVEFNTPDDFPVFRLSGAMLLLAENLVAQGKAGEALQFINPVRVRAGLLPLGAVDADDVADETRHELAFENHRWIDLLRTGKAIQEITKKGNLLKAAYGWILPTSFNITEQRFIYPIPFREVQINTQLVQNPGYN
ncbi:MAG: RagB/SusD family nutrient uptake outer membrane protein [Flavitalea sp.]